MNTEMPQKWLRAIHEREALLDWNSLRRMAEIFVEEADTILERTIEALRSGDLEVARRSAHHLGGNAGSLDFLELAEIAQNIEQACMRADRDIAMMQIQQAVAVTQRNTRQLRQYFKLT